MLWFFTQGPTLSTKLKITAIKWTWKVWNSDPYPKCTMTRRSIHRAPALTRSKYTCSQACAQAVAAAWMGLEHAVQMFTAWVCFPTPSRKKDPWFISHNLWSSWDMTFFIQNIGTISFGKSCLKNTCLNYCLWRTGSCIFGVLHFLAFPIYASLPYLTLWSSAVVRSLSRPESWQRARSQSRPKLPQLQLRVLYCSLTG